MIVADNRYRPVRRRLHDTQWSKGGLRAAYSRGTVDGMQKGRLIGLPGGRSGQLCGTTKRAYRFYDVRGKRQVGTRICWMHGGYKAHRAPAS
jgi:hypothetical protein